LKTGQIMDDSATSRHDAVFDPQTVAGRAFARDLQRAHRSMRGATDKAGLQRAAAQIQALIHRAVGEAPEPLTRFISTLHDTLTRRVIELTCAGTQMPGVRWCWIALGSEGRQEQTLASDQDNGLIFAGSGDAMVLREQLLPMASRINEALDACGFPLCTGQIMASNPQWCLDLHEWRQRFAGWIIEGYPQALLNASIFFDLRPIYGAHDLAQTLADWLGENAPDNPRFLFQMTENALRRKVPLGVIHDFVVEKGGEFAGTIDLKLHAATLFVDAARIYGLACGARANNTADRLRLAAEAQRLDQRDAQVWMRAFDFIQMLRLKNQQRCYERGAVMHNHVNPSELDPAERRALLDALRQARALQKRLALDYLGTHQGL
jgi:CBS domain-containing protein